MTIGTGNGRFVLTTVITIIPRYILVNKLPFNLRVSQFKCNEEIIMEPGSRIRYNFEKPTKPSNKKIVIGDSLQENELSDTSQFLSLPFFLDDIADFQIPYKSQYIIDSENPLWHEPSKKNKGTRCVRVIVTSQDDATLFIYFQTPNLPEYTINNATMETVTISVKDSKK